MHALDIAQRPSDHLARDAHPLREAPTGGRGRLSEKNSPLLARRPSPPLPPGLRSMTPPGRTEVRRLSLEERGFCSEPRKRASPNPPSDFPPWGRLPARGHGWLSEQRSPILSWNGGGLGSGPALVD